MLFSPYKKEKAMLIRREGNIFQTSWSKILEDKKTHERYLLFDKQRYMLKDGIEPLLYKRKSRYYKLYFMENGRLIQPNGSLIDAWQPLLTESDVLAIKERSALSELLKPKLEKPDLFFTIMAIALGLLAGIIIGYFILSHAAVQSGSAATTVYHVANSTGGK